MQILKHSRLVQQSPGIESYLKWINVYMWFPMDENTGEEMTKQEQQVVENDLLRQVQNILYEEHGLQMTFQEIGRASFENRLKNKYQDVPGLLERLNVSKVGGEEAEVERIVREGVSMYDLQLASLKEALCTTHS